MIAHISLDIGAFEIGCAGARHKNQIIRRVRIDIHMRESRSDNPAAAVASDCFADLFGGGYSDSKVIIFIF